MRDYHRYAFMFDIIIITILSRGDETCCQRRRLAASACITPPPAPAPPVSFHPVTAAARRLKFFFSASAARADAAVGAPMPLLMTPRRHRVAAACGHTVLFVFCSSFLAAPPQFCSAACCHASTCMSQMRCRPCLLFQKPAQKVISCHVMAGKAVRHASHVLRYI